MAFKRKINNTSTKNRKPLTLVTAFKSFIASTINLPLQTKIQKITVYGEEVRLQDAMIRPVVENVKEEVDVVEAIEGLFGGNEKSLKYNIDSFERLNGYIKNEDYKKINEKFISLVRNEYGLS